MNGFDIGLLVIGLIAVIIGLSKGFAKMFTTFLRILLALAGSIALTVVLMKVVRTWDAFDSVRPFVSSWFGKSSMHTPVASEEELGTLLASGGFLKIFSGLSGKIFVAMGKIGADTLGGYFGHLIASAIVGIIIWIICYLLCKLALRLLKKLLDLIAKTPVVRSIDKILGLTWSITLFYLIVVGVLYSMFVIVCVKVPQLASLSDKVSELVSNSTIFHYVHETNFIGDFIGGLFKVKMADFLL